jgi:hypothetical protein
MRESGKITRRVAIVGSFAATYTPVFAASAVLASDPIFAAIATHRRAYADLLVLFEAQMAADQALQAANTLTRPALAARLRAVCEAEGPLGRVEMQASRRLTETVPTTLEGAVAVLRYLRELFARDDYAPIEEDGYRTLAFSTERAIERYCVRSW